MIDKILKEFFEPTLLNVDFILRGASKKICELSLAQFVDSIFHWTRIIKFERILIVTQNHN